MFNIFNTNFDKEKYIIVKYFLESKTSLRDAAWEVSLGQSLGNPHARSIFETEEMFKNHSCIVLHKEEELLNKKEGIVNIAFPNINIDLETDGLNQLMCFILGGNLDISNIIKCQVKDIQFNKEILKTFKGPKLGIKEIRDFCKVYDKPIIGSILKPKSGMSKQVLLEMVKELVSGGTNFIKEDEILSLGKGFCPLEERVPLISNYLKDKNVIYCFSITSDPIHLLERVKLVYKLGGNGVHFNIHCGLGAYKSVRELDLPLFVHLQKSGDKLWTNQQHNFHIDFTVMCKLIALSGVSTAHTGMWGGGYLDDDETMMENLVRIFNENNSIPAFSCGLHPGLVQKITKRFGNDILLNSGGNVMSHPMGPRAGVKALIQARDGLTNEPEYLEAIKKWKLVE